MKDRTSRQFVFPRLEIIPIQFVAIPGRKLMSLFAGFIPECYDKARGVFFGMEHFPEIFFADAVIMDFSHSILLSC
jgi:hypothetical protein